MNRPLAVGFVLLLALAAFADLYAAPARPLFVPIVRPPAPHIDFRGTQWFGKTYEGADWTIIFETTGAITNIEGPNTYRVGSWKATGPFSVYMELNNHYYEYRGVVTGDVLAGESSNVNGLRWKTTFRRIATMQQASR
ncbi:MAG TPA: hypothetical protein VFE62_18515 [Gemmataceae bacterium]|nr:hypothetical protein [Gemmataceae bacterium]